MADTEGDFLDGTPADDIEMVGEDTFAQVEITAAPAPDAEGEDVLPFQDEAMEEDKPARITYIDYLKSPIIGLLVGQGENQALLTAHQALLTQSPWFAEACAKFQEDTSVSFNGTR